MDLKIVITDENDEVLEAFAVYQDGSDLEGAALIREKVYELFPVEEEEDDG